jgi:hypothetical protein
MPAAPRPPQLQPRRVPLGVLLGVLALHAVLLMLMLGLGIGRDRGPTPASEPPAVLWLLDRRPPPELVSRDPTPVRPQTRPARAVTPPRPAPGEPQAITLPAPAAEAPREAQRTTETASPPAAPPTALNFALPRAASAAWRQRSPALDDARANTRVAVNLATLVDQALGGDPNGPIREEPLADGSVRFRRGSQCVVARPNKAQNIDPFNGSVLPKPRLLDPC